MPLTTTRITSVTPRGGGAGTHIVVQGEEFGVAQGTIVLDPLSLSITATPTLWSNDQVEFDVPSGLAKDRILTLQIIRADNADFAAAPFWVPADDPENNGIDYQYPNAEEGAADANEDDPRRASAADFNRILDRLGVALAIAGDMQKSVYDQDNDGVVDAAEGIVDGVNVRTWADILNVIRTPTLHRFSGVVNGQTVFTLPSTPDDATMVLFIVNGTVYTSPTFHTVTGSTLTWKNVDFQIASTDRVEAVYWT